ncbi:MAG: lytic transglycosylase domain-containing protein [Actinomycetota bacterium]
MTLVLAAVAVAAVGFMAAALAALLLVMLILGAQAEADARPVAGPSEAALADIPADLLPVYREAAESTCAMRWSVLAAVGSVESDHGRSTLPGVHSGANSSGAMGPMQFLGPTWAAYGVDGDGDGARDVYNPVDAIWGAANYLCANGAGDGRERNALWHYNHADWYVDQVLEIAATYEAAGSVPPGDARALVDHPNLTLTPGARQDLLDGIIDQRVVDLLAWAVERHTIAVSVLKTGHSQYVAGTNRVSNHWVGRGVDIYAVAGELVSRSSGAARAFAIAALDLSPPARPTETGLPWPDLTDRPGVFSDDAHQGHIHFGWSANPPE